MKISNAIAIIALGLQGFLLHADAAPSYRLRGGGSDFDTIDLADDAGYHGYDYGYGEDNPSPSSSSYYPDADGSEDFDDFEMDSPESSVMAGTGAGVYIQGPIEGATRHGTVCRFPFLLVVTTLCAGIVQGVEAQSVLIITNAFLRMLEYATDAKGIVAATARQMGHNSVVKCIGMVIVFGIGRRRETTSTSTFIKLG